MACGVCGLLMKIKDEDLKQKAITRASDPHALHDLGHLLVAVLGEDAGVVGVAEEAQLALDDVHELCVPELLVGQRGEVVAEAALEDRPGRLHRGQRRAGAGEVEDADALALQVGLHGGIPVVAGLVQDDDGVLGV